MASLTLTAWIIGGNGIEMRGFVLPRHLYSLCHLVGGTSSDVERHPVW